MKEEVAKRKTCPILSTVVHDPGNENTSPAIYLWEEFCRGSECMCWESNEPTETGGKLFDNGHCGLKYNPLI